MNTAPTITSLRSAFAAFLALLLLAAGALTAVPARALDGAAISGTVTAASSQTGLTVAVEASGLGASTQAYAALIVKGTESGISGNGGYAAFASPFPAIVDGSTSFALTAAPGALDRTKTYEVLIWQVHSPADADTIFARSDVVISSAQWDAVFPPADPEPEPTTEPTDDPTDEPTTEPTTDPTDEPTNEPTEEPTEPPTSAPQLSVFLADGVTPVGDTIVRAGDSLVVRGTGYDPTDNVGGRGAPIPSTLPQGTYVVFGNFGETWEPSQGAASSTRKVGSQKWALAEEVLNQVPSSYQAAIRAQWTPIAPDGSLETTLTVTRPTTLADGGRYGVFTYGAGGVVNADQEREVLVDVMPAPALSVYLADGVTPLAGHTVDVGDTLVVAGTGYDPAANIGGRGVPIPSTLPQGTYVVFGSFAEQWRPSEGASSAARKVTSQKWALAESVLDQVPSQYQSAIRSQWTPIAPDGSFRTTLTVTESTAPPVGGTYGVYTYPAGGVTNAAQELGVPVTLTPPPSIDVSVPTATQADGATVRVVGSDFADVTGAYAAVIEKGTEASVTGNGGYVAFGYWMTPGAITGGAFDKTLVAPTDKLDRAKQYEVIVWRGHTNPSVETIYARADVSISAAQWDILFPGTPEEPEVPTVPVDPVPPAAVAGGSLTWGISSSFAEYVTGSIAHGSIIVSGGATRSGGLFQFGQAPGSTYDPNTGVGSVSYSGGVRFTGHGGLLDLSLSNPEFRFTSPASAQLWVTSGGSRVHLATVGVGVAARSVSAGAVTFGNAPVVLTSAGSALFQGRYGTLDPVTFTIGAAAAAPAGVSGTVAAARVDTPPTRTIPPTPPSTTGIVLDAGSLAALSTGASFTIRVGGFQPRETGIALVVYSTPTVLATDLVADASGVVTWTGSLPATLADGEHTLTVQGSVSRGVAFTLARAAAAGACVVDNASLRWGFKESFRTYIEGIAGGGWELDGVAYEYPDFVWSNGSGSLDTSAAPTGVIDFGGAIRFTGHGGALDTTLSAARIEFAGDVGYVVFDITGTTQSGEAIAMTGVRFAEFTLPTDAVQTDAMGPNAITLDAVPVTLTSAGSSAFGSYPEGEQLDPLTLQVPLAAECGVAAEVTATDGDEPLAAPETDAAAAAESLPVWPWVAGGVGLALLLAIAVTVTVRRRAAAAHSAGAGAGAGSGADDQAGPTA